MSDIEPDDDSFDQLPPQSDGDRSSVPASSRSLRTSQTPMSHDTMSRHGHSDRSSSMMPTSPLRPSDIDDLIDNYEDDTHRGLHSSASRRSKDKYSTRRGLSYTSEDGYLFTGAVEDLATLKQAWITERAAPELLKFEGILVDRVMNRIRKQIEYIEINSMDMSQGSDTKLKLLLVETDLERVKFILRGYLRSRLAKIDKFTLFLSRDLEQHAKLSEEEIEYMTAHNQILTRLYRVQFLNKIPEHLRALDDTSDVSMIEEPDLSHAVFVRVVRDVPYPVTIGNQRLPLEKDGVYALRYSAVAELVEDKSVVLI